MKKIIIMLLLVVALFANNPIVYSSLGDEIYDNAIKIEKLKNVNLYNLQNERIDKYIAEVDRVKSYGYLVDNKSIDTDKSKYLVKLRNIIKINNEFINELENHLRFAIKNNENHFFSQLINSGLIDFNKFYDEIKVYSYSHQGEVTLPHTLQDRFLKDENELNNKDVKYTKAQRNQQRIKRIKASYKAKQNALENILEDEAKRKKALINENQMRELIR